ncbi:hypothetical protein Q5P01_008859 [Channa striata]|uniref:Uncharacterized protein n=1 Tax=Channa striata TaxID=64152 RepID=A0AA88N1G5_CHASR|nr:hypothetical protein Q5P01_008859 [Channa striata]
MQLLLFKDVGRIATAKLVPDVARSSVFPGSAIKLFELPTKNYIEAASAVHKEGIPLFRPAVFQCFF